MATIYFATDTDLDPGTITLMGVSVKVGSTPIGHFGTGLKYAIATLLRTGHAVEIARSNAWGLGNSATHEFTLDPVSVRGRSFDRVVMDGEGLGFTTQLGRDWAVWMAYRELRSNCVDEGVHYVGAELPDHDWGTVIRITGDDIAQAHAWAHKIFCQGDVIHPSAWCEVRHHLPGTEQYMFYRGIRAMELGKRSHYTYNITQQCALTEDRTLKYAFEANCWVAHAIVSCRDLAVLERTLLRHEGTAYWEDSLDYASVSHSYVSAEFRDVCNKYRTDNRLNKLALALADKGRQPPIPQTVTLTPDEEDVLLSARSIALAADPHYTERPALLFVRNLGPNVFGTARGSQVYISMLGIEQGPEHLAATLLEEYMHVHMGLGDETRAMQDALLSAVVRLASRRMASVPEVRAMLACAQAEDVGAHEVVVPLEMPF